MSIFLSEGKDCSHILCNKARTYPRTLHSLALSSPKHGVCDSCLLQWKDRASALLFFPFNLRSGAKNYERRPLPYFLDYNRHLSRTWCLGKDITDAYVNMPHRNGGPSTLPSSFPNNNNKHALGAYGHGKTI